MKDESLVDPAGDEVSANDLDRVEELVARCLDLSGKERAAAVETACRENPKLAGTLRRQIELLADLGMDSTAPEALPERIGEFRLLERLGSGGMGIVYRARQDSLQREVALKLVRPDLLYFDSARERFRREVLTIASLHHRNIVPIFSVGEESGVPYYSMELIEGVSFAEILAELEGADPARIDGEALQAAVLRSYARRNDSHGADRDSATGRFAMTALSPACRELLSGPWSEIATRIARCIADAVAHAHRRQVLHRDLKPSNIMLGLDGRVLLLDFGLASTTNVDRMTKTGALVGSLPYMAPEQVRGDVEHIDTRTDVYGIGATLYEMLTLRLPHPTDTAEHTRKAILEGDHEPLRHFHPGLARDLETVCLVALDPDPARRYPDADSLAWDLQAILERRPIRARPTPLWLRARRWTQRHPRASAGAALGVLAMLALLSFAIREHFNALRNHKLQLEASEAKVRTDALLEDVLRLADHKLIDELTLEMDEYWPLLPELVVRIDDWLLRAQELAGRRDQHRAALTNLQSRIERTASETDENSALVRQRLQWQVDVQLEVVRRLEDFEACIGEMRERREFADQLRSITLETPDVAAAWEEAINSVALEDVYQGLEMQPQLGLVPLEHDPQSRLYEFWHPQSGSRPERDLDTEHWKILPETGLVFVLVPPGSFKMGSYAVTEQHPLGSPLADPWHLRNEEPVHPVTLDAFFLSKYEMTESQWWRATAKGPERRRPPKSGPLAATPCCDIDWARAAQVMQRFGLRLPTDAQFEYACRAGTTTVFYFGDDRELIREYENLESLDLRRETGTIVLEIVEPWEDGFHVEAPVGSFRSNPWGFHDLMGNVMEWCMDHALFFKQAGPRPGDGLRWQTGPDPGWHIARGSSYVHLATFARSACRLPQEAGNHSPSLGVRPARELRK